MPAPMDRPSHILEQFDPAFPLPPLNFSVRSGLEKNVIDLRWTNPSEISGNTNFSIIGVNIYRSFDSEYGPWFRLNSLPIGATFWRDKTQTSVIYNEDVSNNFIARGPTDPDGRWVFRSAKKPIMIDDYRSPDCTNVNVQVTVNGVMAHVQRIVPNLGEIELSSASMFDVASQTQKEAVLPINSDDIVLASYRFIDNQVNTSLTQRIFYRITAVAVDNCGSLTETPLDRAASANNRQTEQVDWVWREPIRRNRFLLYEAGERVKVFIRKCVGVVCGCYSDLRGQPDNSCLICYGTGIIGGYDGPYDLLIAPDDAEKAISQSNRGRTVNHSYDTWTGPSPLLSQRDFVVKLTGDRYAIGPVRQPTTRGIILQQHFSISHFDETDIRYQVPVMDTSVLISPQTRYTDPGRGLALPIMTERSAIPDEREFRQSSVNAENKYRR